MQEGEDHDDYEYPPPAYSHFILHAPGELLPHCGGEKINMGEESKMKIAFIAIAIVLITTPAFAQYRQQGGGYDNVSCIRKQWRCADIPTAPVLTATTHKHQQTMPMPLQRCMQTPDGNGGYPASGQG